MIRSAIASAAAGVLVSLGGCVLVPPGPGTAEAEVLRQWGPPSARYMLGPGEQRLEYATGPFGRTTWMLDLDSGGRLLRAEQVLAEPRLWALQGRLPGMSREQLQQTLGTPGNRRSGGRQGGEIWSWRYDTRECLWFRVSIGDDGRVRDGGFYPDPVCDGGPNDPH